MAQIDLEKKEGGGLGWLWALLALILLGLLAWWLMGAGDGDVEVDEPVVAAVEEPIDTEVEVEMLPVAALVATPADWIGQVIDGEALVVEVPTDRGFWLEDDGQRVFALIVDEPVEAPMDINVGQRLRISEAMVYDASTSLDEIDGRPVDADTRAILEGIDVFLVIDEEDMEIL